MKIGVYSHCTIDSIVSGDSTYETAGGPACYCSLTARNQRFDVNLVTKYGKDFPLSQFLEKNKISFSQKSVIFVRYFLYTIFTNRIIFQFFGHWPDKTTSGPLPPLNCSAFPGELFHPLALCFRPWDQSGAGKPARLPPSP